MTKKKQKSSKDKKTVTLKLDLEKAEKRLKKSLSPQLFTKLSQATLIAVRDAKRHFRVDGWKLDYGLIKESIIADTLGGDPDTFIMGQMLKVSNIHSEPKTGRWFLVKKKGKK